MKISQAVSPAKDITVPFEGASLAVTYRPLTYTVRQMDEMQAEQAAAGPRATRRILETIQSLVTTWDLEFDDDDPQGRTGVIPLTGDLDDDHPLRDVHSHIFTAIIKAVNEDQVPGGSKASAGS